MSLIKELKRRNVFRVAVAYGVVAWLLIQVGATLEPAMHLPEWTDSILAFFLLLGFPIAMFFAWAYELTPDGLKRDGDIAPDAGERAVASQKWDRLIILLLVLALGYFAVDKYFITESAIESAGLNPDAAETDALTGVSSKSIAVLPFVNMSSDPEQEYFSDGLTEELLNLLAGIDDLKVAARTSSFFYKNKVEDIPMREIAQQLEVAHILEGSVRRDGNQIRITAQLIKADDGFHLWSETYDRTLDSIFVIQDEIAAVVVDQLKITLLGELPHAKVVNTESLDLTMEGRYLFNRRQEGDKGIGRMLMRISNVRLNWTPRMSKPGPGFHHCMDT
jgi:TolB-like protein